MARRQKAKAMGRRLDLDDDGGSSPTHYLKMKTTDRDGAGWTRVGVAWEKANGVYSIKLNRGVVLDWHDFAVEDPEFVLIMVEAD